MAQMVRLSNNEQVGRSVHVTTGSYAMYGGISLSFLVNIVDISDVYMIQLIRNEAETNPITIGYDNNAFQDVIQNPTANIVVLVENVGMLTDMQNISPGLSDLYSMGDYKYSFQNSDHGFWKLCDGQFLAIDGKYKLLFDEIGYTFGQYIDSISNKSYFQLPNVTDSVVGIVGGSHFLGDEVGSENYTLSEDEMPSHRHLTTSYSHCNTNGFGDTDIYLSYACDNPAWVGTEYKYGLHGQTIPPDSFPTSTMGGDQSFSTMQPTKFVAHLFICTGII
eukprot:464227_1